MLNSSDKMFAWAAVFQSKSSHLGREAAEIQAITQ